MNCKPGDLAITHGMPMDNGIIVEVIALVAMPVGYEHLGPCWHVESQGSLFNLTPTRLSRDAHLPDSHLKPIRDNDGEDETLQWAPVPVKEAA